LKKVDPLKIIDKYKLGRDIENNFMVLFEGDVDELK